MSISSAAEIEFERVRQEREAELNPKPVVTAGHIKVKVLNEPVQIADTHLEPGNTYLVPADQFLYDPNDSNIVVEEPEPRLKLLKTKLPDAEYKESEAIRKRVQSHQERLQESQHNDMQVLIKQQAETTEKLAKTQEQLANAMTQIMTLMAERQAPPPKDE